MLLLAWLWCVSAFAADPRDQLAEHARRAFEADVLLGVPVDLRTEVRVLENAGHQGPEGPWEEGLLRAWTLGAGGAGPAIRVGGRGHLAMGSMRPLLRDGDTESRWLSPRIGPRIRGDWGPLVGEMDADVGLDAIPAVAPVWVPRWRVGLQTPGFHLDVGQVPRHFGPGETSLLQSRDATPPPGASVGGSARLPGKAAVAGRFGAQLAMGWLPGDRDDVRQPGWLVLDLRWRPTTWLEVGVGRTSLFGGVDEGRRRPVDVGQLILPTRPHVVDDPEQQLPDTDEAAAIDLQLALPLARWLGGPIDQVSLYWQYGGEDVIARSLGPIPYPSLAGVGNLYGLRIQGGPFWGRVEGAILEDDVFRWYRGHRIYHEGWVHRGQSMGHPRGGDMRSLTVSLGALDPELGLVTLQGEVTRRVQVADRIEGTVFVLLEPEHRQQLRLTAARPVGSWWVQGELGGGQVRNTDFVPGDHRPEIRAAVTVWTPLAVVARRR